MVFLWLGIKLGFGSNIFDQFYIHVLMYNVGGFLNTERLVLKKLFFCEYACGIWCLAKQLFIYSENPQNPL